MYCFFKQIVFRPPHVSLMSLAPPSYCCVSLNSLRGVPSDCVRSTLFKKCPGNVIKIWKVCFQIFVAFVLDGALVGLFAILHFNLSKYLTAIYTFGNWGEIHAIEELWNVMTSA